MIHFLPGSTSPHPADDAGGDPASIARDTPGPSARRPWPERVRSVAPWLGLAIVLTAGLAPFLRMPLWADTTLYDAAARNVIDGGIHYRDVFDTNLPGMVWAQIAVRSALGWSWEAMRAADLLVFAGIVLLLGKAVGRAGVGSVGRVWLAATLAAFYLFIDDFSHCQRDTWMLLPASAAVMLRLTRPAVPFRHVLEGFLWGAAFWIKPHVIVPAALIWLADQRCRSDRRSVVADAFAVILGGVLAGVPGVLWLHASGTWPHFWDVMLHWNSTYYDWSWAEYRLRFNNVLMYFSPWSLLHVAALPVALASLFARPSDPVRRARLLIAALYLGWMAQAVFLQKRFDYVHAPTILLALTVLASRRLPIGPVMFSWCALSMFLLWSARQWEPLGLVRDWAVANHPNTVRQVLPRHRIFDPNRAGVWWQTIVGPATPELHNVLGSKHRWPVAPDWEQFAAVESFLSSQDLRDGELLCWNSATHPLYLRLGVAPPIRYMHVETALLIPGHERQIMEESRNCGARFVVGDLRTQLYGSWEPTEGVSETEPELPPEMSAGWRRVFPWNLPVVFRCGRFVVLEMPRP